MVSRGFLAFLCIAVAACDQSAFDAFKARYGKVYASPEEEAARAAVFAANTAALHTSKDGATLGVTKFSDLTPDEFSFRKRNEFVAKSYDQVPMIVSPAKTELRVRQSKGHHLRKSAIIRNNY